MCHKNAKKENNSRTGTSVRILSATTRTWLCLSVCPLSFSPLPPFPLLPCPVAAHRFSIFVTFILYNLLSWQFFCRSPLAFFCAHALDNAVWIGQKLNSFAYMRIIYFVDSLSPPPSFKGTSWSKKSEKWKAKPKLETGKRKAESSAACLMAEAANQPRTHL